MPESNVDKVAELLERSGIDADNIERVTRVNVWQGFIKNKDEEIETTDLTSVQFIPTRDTEHSFINQAAPTIIRPSKRLKPTRSDSVSVILPDMQIGYRNDEAFHDERCLTLGLAACRELKPDNIVLLGDNLDQPTQSRFDNQGKGWTDRIQPALDRLHSYLAQLRADNPDANMVVHWGNHDIRLKKQIQKFNAELLGLRRANAEEELGVLSLQYLLRTEELGITSIDSYPRGVYWLEDNLLTTHGHVVRSSGNSAQAVLTNAEASVIFGHVHRIEVATKTVALRGIARTIQAVTPGTFARIDGSVPSNNYTTNDRDETVKGYDNWQNGLAVVFHNERNHQINPILIEEGRMNMFGKTYEA